MSSVEDIVEDCRVNLVRAMRAGATCVLHVDKLCPNFKGEFRSDDFPFREIVNIDKWEQNFKSIVKQEEDYDRFQNRNMFSIETGYKFVVLSQAPDVESEIEEMK